MSLTYAFNEELWLYPGDGAWHFITLPAAIADEIRTISDPIRRGFGSVKVTATIGETTWNTSIFPDAKSKSYVLPVKKDVRSKNNLHAGDKVKAVISIIDHIG